jgi:hypothetical protein
MHNQTLDNFPNVNFCEDDEHELNSFSYTAINLQNSVIAKCTHFSLEQAVGRLVNEEEYNDLYIANDNSALNETIKVELLVPEYVALEFNNRDNNVVIRYNGKYLITISKSICARHFIVM